jgi:hypothetical protein
MVRLERDLFDDEYEIDTKQCPDPRWASWNMYSFGNLVYDLLVTDCNFVVVSLCASGVLVFIGVWEHTLARSSQWIWIRGLSSRSRYISCYSLSVQAPNTLHPTLVYAEVGQSQGELVLGGASEARARSTRTVRRPIR